MFRHLCVVALLMAGWSNHGWALETLALKDGAAITGRILAEKPEHYVVDLGYTVVLVPKNEVIHRDARAAEPEPEPGPATEAPPAASGTPPASPRAVNGTDLFFAADTPGPESSVRALVARLGEAVVQVRTPSGLGSGFFINETGYLITNFHVIEGETQISVEVYHRESDQLERRSYKAVRIVAMNKFRDLALLKVEDGGARRFVAVPLGQTDTLAVGERVFAIGSPHGLERTVTEGIVSTKTREMRGDLFLQTTAPINQGNSGGPLFNLRGEVVGVTNMKITFSEGLGFAIPVEEVRNFLKRRDAFAFDNNNPSSGYRYLEPPRRLKDGGLEPET
jgi:serine protease Do